MASNRLGGSDTQASRQQAERKGRTTAEYKKVKENMKSFIDTIDSIPYGVKHLTTKFREAGWLALYAKDISADDLIIQALDRIKNDAAEHQVFLDMLRDIVGTDQIVAMLNVQEESHPSDDSLDISTMGPGPSKYPNKERPANKKESPQNEPDSGYDRSTPDTTSVDSEQPHESPPLELKPKICGGNLVLNVGENALFVSASGRHNIIVQQGHIESKSVTIMQQSTIATESHPPQPEEPTDKACFGGLSTTEQSGEQSNHLREIEQRNAEIEELKRENSKLKQQLEDEKRRRKTLRESYDQLERSAKQNEAAARSELEKKVKELEECQSTISTMEKTHEEKCTKLQTDIDDLKKKIEEKNRSTQHEKMELKTRLCETETALHKTEKLLAEKENDVLKKEIEIKDLEMVILQKENKELKKKLGRKHQKCESMCTELSSPLSTLKIDEDSSFSD